MKKVFLVFAIVFVSNVFKSCTDLYEKLENEPVKFEVLDTGGEDEQEIEEEDDPTNSG
ncbi:MAG: beta-lactamase superfamily II metal-dependent hydrolase [Polaribacter sp.]|jgi:beta-lactamase superfamily II metal-dependent hydrolase